MQNQTTYTIKGRKAKKPIGTPYISFRDFDENGKVDCFVGYWGKSAKTAEETYENNKSYKFDSWVDSDEFLHKIGCPNNITSVKFHNKVKHDKTRFKELKPLAHTLFDEELEKFFTEDIYDVEEFILEMKDMPDEQNFDEDDFY